MLVFIIPIKSKKTAKSWQECSKLFDRCLRSVCNQTSQNFKVIVVCNEKPITTFKHPNVEYLIVDFPPPGSDYGAKGDDRAKRVYVALFTIKDLKPSHVMSVDSDDCISKYIAEFVNQNPDKNGWYVEQGYEYDEGSSQIAVRQKGIYRICGTCNIINYRLFKVPDQILPYDQLVGFDRFLNGHPLAKGDLEKRGNPLEPLPFPGTIYVRDQVGESISMQEPVIVKFQRNPKEVFRGFKKLFMAPFVNKRLTKEIQEEFGLYPLN
ncbi:MAG: glycosyltransferase family 2 protein [Sphaerospermopsis sp. SIO1G1]|nr:glycosyltransferase family 2 protein [Sphaerospermopsis sp. SIO1G1]